MTETALIEAVDLSLDAPGGRPLLRDLRLSLGRDRVALIGRNGVGKSTLLEVLAGHELPERGRVSVRGTRWLVRQQLTAADLGALAVDLSPGELRRRCLERARRLNPEVLFLDEPTQDLDDEAVEELLGWLDTWSGALLVVSHDRRLLVRFRHFFIVAESGCRLISGSFDELLQTLDGEELDRQREYVSNLNRLLEREKHNESVRRRRQRKKNVGRVREVDRGPSRALLNAKRSYAQESQGKRAVLQKKRIAAVRDWAKATRRALSVALPLKLALPELPDDTGATLIKLSGLKAEAGTRVLFEDLDLSLGRERLAVVGPNGAGKTTLVQIMMGERRPTSGVVQVMNDKLGYVAQNARNWMLEQSLLSHLVTDPTSSDAERVAGILAAHRFPFALAERPLASLSPGERLRAGLICLFQRQPCVQMLVLDEPTIHLDFVGIAALGAVLRSWRGGLVVVSHDTAFLDAIGVDRRLVLDEPRGAGQATARPGVALASLAGTGQRSM